MTRYGFAPDDLGPINLSPNEMMFWLYCPISLPGLWVRQLPANLRQFRPIVDAVHSDSGERKWDESYVYLTVKTLFITPENPGNRPGWHSDGFLTDDINYIWYDSEPTLFWVASDPVHLPADHQESMTRMESLSKRCGDIVSFPCKHLLRLDQSHIHRVADISTSGVRTFIKVSVSRHLYGQIGNSINHGLDYQRPKFHRTAIRNCPATPPHS